MKREWVRLGPTEMTERDRCEAAIRFRITEYTESDEFRKAIEAEFGEIVTWSREQCDAFDRHKRKIVDQAVSETLQRMFPN